MHSELTFNMANKKQPTVPNRKDKKFDFKEDDESLNEEDLAPINDNKGRGRKKKNKKKKTSPDVYLSPQRPDENKGSPLKSSNVFTSPESQKVHVFLGENMQKPVVRNSSRRLLKKGSSKRMVN